MHNPSACLDLDLTVLTKLWSESLCTQCLQLRGTVHLNAPTQLYIAFKVCNVG